MSGLSMAAIAFAIILAAVWVAIRLDKPQPKPTREVEQILGSILDAELEIGLAARNGDVVAQAEWSLALAHLRGRLADVQGRERVTR